MDQQTTELVLISIHTVIVLISIHTVIIFGLLYTTPLYVRIHSYVMGVNHNINCSTKGISKKKTFALLILQCFPNCSNQETTGILQKRQKSRVVFRPE